MTHCSKMIAGVRPLLYLALAMALQPVLRASAADVLTRTSGGNLLLRVDGDNDNDWHIQASTHLTNCITLTNLGTLLAGKPTNAPERAVGPLTGPGQYFRALRTAGLFDPSLFRTIDLTFTQANWTALLSTARNTGSNVWCSQITMDNGAAT